MYSCQPWTAAIGESCKLNRKRTAELNGPDSINVTPTSGVSAANGSQETSKAQGSDAGVGSVGHKVDIIIVAGGAS